MLWASPIRKYDIMEMHDMSFQSPVRLEEIESGGNDLGI